MLIARFLNILSIAHVTPNTAGVVTIKFINSSTDS